MPSSHTRLLPLKFNDPLNPTVLLFFLNEQNPKPYQGGGAVFSYFGWLIKSAKSLTAVVAS